MKLACFNGKSSRSPRPENRQGTIANPLDKRRNNGRILHTEEELRTLAALSTFSIVQLEIVSGTELITQYLNVAGQRIISCRYRRSRSDNSSQTKSLCRYQSALSPRNRYISKLRTSESINQALLSLYLSIYLYVSG